MTNRFRPSVAICAFLACMGCSTLHRQSADPFGYRQLTKDGGETSCPSLSRDGKFVVYASDRASPGNLDIWVQAVDRGTPVRVTDHPARDYDPVFSADGQMVYFTSLREPAGIYRARAAGGDSELVARGAASPEMSPDGKTLLFSDAAGHVAALRLADGFSRPLLENFFNSYAAKW